MIKKIRIKSPQPQSLGLKIGSPMFFPHEALTTQLNQAAGSKLNQNAILTRSLNNTLQSGKHITTAEENRFNILD